MNFTQKYISILNWVEPRFTYEQLFKLKSNWPLFSQKQIESLFIKKESIYEYLRLVEDLQLAVSKNINILCSLSELYPQEIKQNIKYPCPLMFRGSWHRDRFNLSVVGSRKPNRASMSWLEDELYQCLMSLKTHGKSVNIMSGGAYGVDQKAHQVSLLSRTPTTCFLPSGMNECYPSNVEPLIHQIEEEGGTVISPFPPNYPLFKSNFYYRNRILVLLSHLVFVVEARRRSGTMMTSSLATKFGKPLVVLPQAPHSTCLGGLDLISSGAPLVKNKDDLIFQVDQSPHYF